MIQPQNLFMDETEQEILKIFNIEAKDRIKKLTEGLLQLEKNPSPINPDLLNDLKREAHTLKGAARLFALSKIETLAYTIEDQLASFQTLKNASPSIDKTLKILDELEKELTIIPSIQSDTTQKNDTVIEKCHDEIASEYIKVSSENINSLFHLSAELMSKKNMTQYNLDTLKKILKSAHDLQKNLTDFEDKISLLTDFTHHQDYAFFKQAKTQSGQLFQELESLKEALISETERFNPLLDEMHFMVKKMRMLPLSTITAHYPRLVRDLAKEQKKKISLEITGDHYELDKNILESLNTALIHLIRNSIDHGIEKEGQILISAQQEAGYLKIEIADTGTGIDLKKIKEVALKKKLISAQKLKELSSSEIMNFVFLAGFSTSPLMTNISGRGMGLDIVKTEIEKLHGTLYLETKSNIGTTFILKLPLNIALIKSFIIQCGPLCLALPLLLIEQIIQVQKKDLNYVNNQPSLELNQHSLPLVELAPLLELDIPCRENCDDLTVIIVQSKIGLIVDRIIKEEEIVIKSLGPFLGKVKNLAGAAILAHGDVVLIVDIPQLIENAKLMTFAPTPSGTALQKSPSKILIVEDSITSRELTKTLLKREGFLVETAVDGLDALNKIPQVKPDLIITDIQMPRMNGFDLCSAVKNQKIYQDIPIIIVSTLEREEDKRKGLEVGAEAYLIKGKTEQYNLLDTIKRLL